jgi:hypothetical protein
LRSVSSTSSVPGRSTLMTTSLRLPASTAEWTCRRQAGWCYFTKGEPGQLPEKTVIRVHATAGGTRQAATQLEVLHNALHGAP